MPAARASAPDMTRARRRLPRAFVTRGFADAVHSTRLTDLETEPDFFEDYHGLAFTES
jgi:hypothetical protein